ncbi:hypothetical protein ACSTKO_24750, partial [Vibrio parahaemolyticus]
MPIACEGYIKLTGGFCTPTHKLEKNQSSTGSGASTIRDKTLPPPMVASNISNSSTSSTQLRQSPLID